MRTVVCAGRDAQVDESADEVLSCAEEFYLAFGENEMGEFQEAQEGSEERGECFGARNERTTGKCGRGVRPRG